jgi:hypothetical protein
VDLIVSAIITLWRNCRHVRVANSLKYLIVSRFSLHLIGNSNILEAVDLL